MGNLTSIATSRVAPRLLNPDTNLRRKIRVNPSVNHPADTCIASPTRFVITTTARAIKLMYSDELKLQNCIQQVVKKTQNKLESESGKKKSKIVHNQSRDRLISSPARASLAKYCETIGTKYRKQKESKTLIRKNRTRSQRPHRMTSPTRRQCI